MMDTTSIQESFGDAKEVDSSKSSELIQREVVGESPFEKISNGEERFIVLGQYRLTGEFSEREMAKLEKQIKGMNWKFMIAVIGAIAHMEVERLKGGN